MSIESFGRDTYNKTDERLVEVNQSLEGASEGEEKEELTAEQVSIKERQQELVDNAHDEASEEDIDREELGDFHNLLDDKPDSTPEKKSIDSKLDELIDDEPNKLSQRELLDAKLERLIDDEPNKLSQRELLDAKLERLIDDEPSSNTVREQKEIERVRAQKGRKRQDFTKMQEIRKRLNIPEKEQEMPGKKKESKKEEFERRVEEKRMLIQEKLALLTDPKWAKEMMSYEKESGMREEKIESKVERLERNLEGLKSYQEMKKRPFWKDAWSELRGMHTREKGANLLFGGFGALFGGMGEVVLNGISHGGVAALDPTGIGATALAGAGVAVALVEGTRVLFAINEAHHWRKSSKEHAKDILYQL